MKRYVYVLVDTENNIEAIYDRSDLAEKLKKPIEDKLGKTLSIEKHRINSDIASIGAKSNG